MSRYGGDKPAIEIGAKKVRKGIFKKMNQCIEEVQVNHNKKLKFGPSRYARDRTRSSNGSRVRSRDKQRKMVAGAEKIRLRRVGEVRERQD